MWKVFHEKLSSNSLKQRILFSMLLFLVVFFGVTVDENYKVLERGNRL